VADPRQALGVGRVHSNGVACPFNRFSQATSIAALAFSMS
jgi:hypothetical protein